jgi:hypothetical protein
MVQIAGALWPASEVISCKSQHAKLLKTKEKVNLTAKGLNLDPPLGCREHPTSSVLDPQI